MLKCYLNIIDNFIVKMFKKIISKLKTNKKEDDFLSNGKIPWSKGYHTYKWELINSSINDSKLLGSLLQKRLPESFGHRVDERVIEYPWIFSKLNNVKEKILDAGSTFNFNFIVNHPTIKEKDLTILTFAPEANCFHKNRISYVYDDLRNVPFKDELFDVVVSQSTIEHIDMDNSIYGYDIAHNDDEVSKSFEYLKAVSELIRVLKPDGKLLLTFPYGKFENHGFFQQFDEEMLNKLLTLFINRGDFNCTFFKYEEQGWRFANKKELETIVSYNPHTGKGKQNDNAAHCRSVVCIEFIKNHN